jgi:arylsulfatase A-like enzyme
MNISKYITNMAIAAALLPGALLTARAQVIFSLDVGEFSDITSVLFHSEGTNVVTPSAGTTGSAIQFTHNGAVPLDATDVVSQWAIGNGASPTNFAPLLGSQWQFTFTANNSASTATDRLNVYLGSAHNGSGQENYPLGFQIGSGSATTPLAQGVQLVVNGVRNTMTNLNGSVSRSYRFVINESSNTFTALIDSGSGFAQVGAGALPFANSERRVFFGIRDRQPQSGLNEVGTITALTIENFVAPTNQPQIASFTATPATIGPAGSSTLSWSASNFVGLAISPTVGDVTSLTTNGVGSVAVSPASTTTYTLTATNLTGSISAQVTVTVQLPLPVISSFTATPSLISTGQTSTLAWTVSGADYLSLNSGVGNVTGQSSVPVSPASSTVYTLTATNIWGAVQAQAAVTVTGGGSTNKPNFLFIAIDDMKPVCGFMSENPGNFLNRIYPDPVKRAQVKAILTPNIDALAASGVAFHRCYTAASVCRPSRTALMTGYRPNESGITGNADPYFRDASRPLSLRTVTTLPQLLRSNGYFTAGCGKILHTGSDLETDFTGATINGTFYNSWSTWFSGAPSTGSSGTRVMSPWSPTGIEIEFGYDSGPLAGQGDYATADLIARIFENGSVSYNGRTATISTNQPFFLACGIFRPHLPEYMPKAYLDLPELAATNIFATRASLDAMYADLNDVDGGGSLTSGDMYDVRTKGNTYGASIGIAEGDVRGYQETVRHYLAAVVLADRCVKRLLDALNASPYASNTVVVLWSDHGWYLGEKYLFRKTQLWDEACNNVLVIRDPRPGMQAAPGTPCYRTVSLQDLYPTIASLAGVAKPAHVKGYNISPLLKDPRRPWNIPAQTSMGDVAIRAGQWALLKRNPDELYDVANDPDEIVNLINNGAYTQVKNAMNTLLTRSVNNDAFPERDDDSFLNWQMGWWGWLTNTPSKSTNNPDGDIANNYAEYVRFGNPLASDNGAGTPQLVSSPGSIGLQFDVRDKDSNTVYRVEASTNLANWNSIWASSNAAALNAATVSGANTGRRTVLVNTNTGAPQLFLRTRAGSN